MNGLVVANLDTTQRFEARKRRAKTLAVIILVAQLLWAFTMLAGIVLKIADSGVHSFVKHYTNWSWTLQMLFYFATAPAPLLIAYDNNKSLLAKFVSFVVGIAFVPLVGIVFVVAGLVMILLGTRSQFLVVLFQEHAPSFVMLGNDVYHFIPIIALLAYGLINWHFVLYSVNWLLNRRSRWLIALYLAYGGPAISLLWYVTFFNPQVVYQTDIGFLPGAVIVFALLTIFVFAPLTAAIYVFGLGKWPVDDEWLMMRYPLSLSVYEQQAPISFEQTNQKWFDQQSLQSQTPSLPVVFSNANLSHVKHNSAQQNVLSYQQHTSAPGRFSHLGVDITAKLK